MSIPEEIMEAATIDGASTWSIISKMKQSNSNKACFVEVIEKVLYWRSVPTLRVGVPFYVMPVFSSQIHL